MTIVQSIEGTGVQDLYEVADLLGSTGKARKIFALSINHTGRKGFTQIKRTLAKQVGLSQSDTIKHGGISKIHANAQSLQFQVRSRGVFLSLKRFKPVQSRAGVKASPWGKRRLFKHAFMGKSLGGHVFIRTSRQRLPIKKLHGPSIPNEMVKEETAKAFEGVGVALPKRITHELRRATKGKLS